MHVDEFIDDLLHGERVCDIILPRLQVATTLPVQGPISREIDDTVARL